MPRQSERAERLTLRYLDALQPEGVRYRVADLTQRGLKFVVEPNGRKYWIVRFVTSEGKNTEKSLGDWPGLLPEKAREEAAKLRSAVGQGLDPAEESKKVRREATVKRERTFKNVSEAYLAAAEGGTFVRRRAGEGGPKAPTTLFQERHNLTKHILPRLGRRPIADIRRRDIIDLVEDVKVRSGGGAANYCLKVIRRTLMFAVDREMIEVNPALGIVGASARPRSVIASDADLKVLWEALEQAKAPKPPPALPRRPNREYKGEDWKDPYASAAALQFALLTLQRRGEVVSLHRDHIDWGRKLWTIPAMNKKERRVSAVPLSDWACEILKAAFERSGSEWAFVGRDFRTHLAPKVVTRYMARLRKSTGIKDITPHDLRRTARTKLTSDDVGVDEMTAERVLNHVVGSAQQRAYDWNAYETPKRNALQAWANELRRIVEGGERPSNVVRLGARTAEQAARKP